MDKRGRPVGVKLCEYERNGRRCQKLAVRGERYCVNHRPMMLGEMGQSGYLTKVPGFRAPAEGE